MISDAIISPDKLYRYSLIRNWNPLEKEILFIGINPSTADANVDDATIRRLKEFAKVYKYGGLRIHNLYAFRTEDCSQLKEAKDPFGEHNWDFLLKYRNKLKTVVFMWGNNKKDINDIRHRVIEAYPNALCFGHNQDGSPKHPLFLSGETKLIRYDTNHICGSKP